MSRLWVANASSLILLGKASQTSLLVELCDELIIPKTVVREVREKPDGEEVLGKLATAPGVRFTDARPVQHSIEAWDLGPGESQVLAVASAQHGARAVLDDREARRCAASIEVPVIGTLGIVLRAKRKGLISEARPVLDQLREVGLYVSTDLLEQALHYLGE